MSKLTRAYSPKESDLQARLRLLARLDVPKGKASVVTFRTYDDCERLISPPGCTGYSCFPCPDCEGAGCRTCHGAGMIEIENGAQIVPPKPPALWRRVARWLRRAKP